jgi:hypothetical protein
MRARLFSWVVLATTLSGHAAFADEKADCEDAAVQGQKLRNAHKLVEARKALLVCAATQCPVVIQTDCTSWLTEVEQSLPTVVITATDGAGRDRLDVSVTLDDQGPAQKLSGEALPMNPGPHAVHLEGDGGAVLDQTILVKEGLKNQNVTVVLVDSPAPAPKAVTPPPEVPRTSPWRTVGWVAGAAGVVGLGIGTAFGVKAIADKNGAHCDASNACDAGPLRDANTSATISTVGVVTGGVLIAGGAAILLFGPRSETPAKATTTFRVTPVLDARSLGLSLGGSF